MKVLIILTLLIISIINKCEYQLSTINKCTRRQFHKMGHAVLRLFPDHRLSHRLFPDRPFPDLHRDIHIPDQFIEISNLNFRAFSNILNAPLSDLSWKTEICRLEDLRGGAFSIHPCHTPNYLHFTPNFWEAFLWRKSLALGAKQFMKSTSGTNLCHYFVSIHGQH